MTDTSQLDVPLYLSPVWSTSKALWLLVEVRSHITYMPKHRVWGYKTQI